MAERAVLVTRPAAQSAALCERLRAEGCSAVALPMIEINPLDELPAVQLQMVLDLDLYRHVVVVSSNAARWGMEWVSQYWPQLPVGVDWYAIGAATARTLRDFGIVALRPEKVMNSEGLLELPGLREPRGQRVLLIKGEGGRDVLARELGDRGARVDQLCVYRRSVPQFAGGEIAAVLTENSFAAMIFTSGEGLRNMLSLVTRGQRESLRQIPVIVPGQRVADMAADEGFDIVCTADNATDEAIILALRQCLAREGQCER